MSELPPTHTLHDSHVARSQKRIVVILETTPPADAGQPPQEIQCWEMTPDRAADLSQMLALAAIREGVDPRKR